MIRKKQKVHARIHVQCNEIYLDVSYFITYRKFGTAMG